MQSLFSMFFQWLEVLVALEPFIYALSAMVVCALVGVVFSFFRSES